jgi:hypothetical protein
VEDPDTVFETSDPRDLRFPPGKRGMRYMLALDDYFLVYPTKLREYQQKYRGAFRHGGVSPEEMFIPLATLTPRPR